MTTVMLVYFIIEIISGFYLMPIFGTIFGVYFIDYLFVNYNILRASFFAFSPLLAARICYWSARLPFAETILRNC
jgi:hypothetical protein